MSESSELIAQQILNASINKKNWGQVLYNVKVFGAQGDGIYDDTQAVQDAIDTAIFNGASLVYFPPGTYKVTSLSNTETINFVGDNATFVGYGGYITQLGTPVTEYNVKDFGATGDGSTDDLASIQAAVDYALSLPFGGVVVIPSGTYVVSAKIVISSAKPLIIRGNGQSTRLRGKSGFNDKIFEVTTSVVLFKDFEIIGPISGNSVGIKANASNTSRFEGITFQNQNTGIELNASYAVEVISCVFDVCYTYGVTSDTNANNLVIDRCNFFTCGVLNSGHAIKISVGSDNMVFTNNDFENCYVAIQMQDCTAVTIQSNYIEFCVQTPINFVGLCQGVSIVENWFGGNANFIIQNVKNGQLTRNTIWDQTVAYGSNAVDFIIGYNTKTGTGTVASTLMNVPTLLNSWTQQTNYADIGYIKDENGVVQIEGNIVNATAPALPSIAFNLPVGYRPSKIFTFATSGSSGTSNIIVNPNGDVQVYAAPGGTKETGLNGVSFLARG